MNSPKYSSTTNNNKFPPNSSGALLPITGEKMTTYGTIPVSSVEGTNLKFISTAKARIKSGLGTRRPWKQMFNLRSINFPHGVSDAFSRIRTNVGYFRMNYVIIMLSILFVSLLWHPVSLIVFVVMMAAWLFLYFLRDEPLMILHRIIDDRVVLVVLFVVTIVLLLFTGATMNIVVLVVLFVVTIVLLLFTGATMNILSSIMIGLVVMVVHAALRCTDDLFLDEDLVDTGGYLASSSS